MILAKGITAVSTPSGACGRLGSKVLLFAFQYGGQIDVFLSNRLCPLFKICILISVFLSTLR